MKANKLLPPLVGAAILAYFLYMASGAVRAHFAPDDMENLYRYWFRGFWRTVWDNIRFWSTAYRPMGGLFYLPLYHWFGLNPLPYRIAVLLILAVNTYLSYRVADLVTKSNAAASLTAVLVCAQGNMIALYYATSFIYDVLAYFFSLLMLFCYIRIRAQDRELTRVESVLVVCLYIAALNSKEIAVVAAGWVLAYEILMHRPRALRTPLIMVAAGLIYTAGKMFGPESLSKMDGYTMQFSLNRYVLNNTEYMNNFLYTSFFDSALKLAIAWGVLTILCWEFRKPQLWWSWLVVSTATLPVSFVIVSRGGSSLYLPLFGVALLASALLTVLVQRPALRWSLAALIAFGYAHQTIDFWRDRRQTILDTQRLTWSVISQVRGLGKHPGKNSRVMFLNSPFPDWDVYFIADLVWNDPTVHLEIGSKNPSPPTQAELETFDWLLTFEGETLKVLRAR